MCAFKASSVTPFACRRRDFKSPLLSPASAGCVRVRPDQSPAGHNVRRPSAVRRRLKSLAKPWAPPQATLAAAGPGASRAGRPGPSIMTGPAPATIPHAVHWVTARPGLRRLRPTRLLNEWLRRASNDVTLAPLRGPCRQILRLQRRVKALPAACQLEIGSVDAICCDTVKNRRSADPILD
jgi:hypothetical protein